MKITPKRNYCEAHQIPTSKSYANRHLILASVTPGEVFLKNLPLSTDVLTMVKCLELMGLEIKRSGSDLTILNSFPKCERERTTTEEIISLPSGDGGTTNRFLLAMATLGQRKYGFLPDHHYKKRPQEAFISFLDEANIPYGYNEQYYPWLQGPLRTKHKDFLIDVSQTTQYLSGLQLSYYLKKDYHFHPHHLKSSQKYLSITQDLIDRYLLTQRTFEIPSDYSSFSYPAALGLTLGEVCIENLTPPDELQADSAFVSLIQKIGGEIQYDHSLQKMWIKKAKKKELKTFDVDGSLFPDLVPTLVYVASCIEGESRLRELEVLTYKESNRFLELIKILDLFNVSYKIENQFCILIQGSSRPQQEASVTYEAPPDHRMILTAALFMMRNNGGEIIGFEHVKKSYPHFLKGTA